MVTLRARMILVKASSQMVQVFGFMRLGLMPTTRNGAEAMPCNGTGSFSCCQQPTQRRDRGRAMAHCRAGAADCTRNSEWLMVWAIFPPSGSLTSMVACPIMSLDSDTYGHVMTLPADQGY